MTKKHCDLCNKDISYAGWSQHLKSKKHIRNASKEEEEIQKETNEVEELKNIIKEKDELLSNRSVEIKLLREQIKELRKENKELKVVNNITNNNTINVNVVGQENMKGIMNDNVYSAIEVACLGDDYNNIKPNPHKAIELYLNETFINKEDNQNIKYTNDRSNKCEIFKNNKWIKADIDICVIDRIKECPENLEEMLEEYIIRKFSSLNEDENLSNKNWYKQSNFKKDIDVFVNNVDNQIDDNDIKKLKKIFKDIIKKHKIDIYNSTKY